MSRVKWKEVDPIADSTQLSNLKYSDWLANATSVGKPILFNIGHGPEYRSQHLGVVPFL